MNKETSEYLCNAIGDFIARNAPRVPYVKADLQRAKRSFNAREISALRRAGYLTEDFELYYVVNEFLSGISLPEADDGYYRALFQNARKFTTADFAADPYLSAVHVPTVQLGNFTLTNVTYEKGEIFLYDEPDLWADTVVPKIGFCTGTVSFPAIYEGRMPWMSVCPSEIFSMRDDMKKAHGRVLVLGAGLGYYPFIISQSENVESVTIIELSNEIKTICETYLFPYFPAKQKIRIIRADAFGYLESLHGGEYDFCYADIWENHIDGAAAYEKIYPHEVRLCDTEFAYWIQEPILWYLNKKNGGR